MPERQVARKSNRPRDQMWSIEIESMHPWPQAKIGAATFWDRFMRKASAADARRIKFGLIRLFSILMWLTAFCVGNALAANPGGGGGGGGAGFGVFPPGPLLPPPPVPPQFDITGFIQEATLDSAGAICQASDPRLAGGTFKVNGITVIVPCNTILQMPAATLTWQELFSLAPRDIGLPLGANGIPTQTGLALNDTVTLPVATPYNGPLPSYEVHVQGNVVNGKYIAGLIFISQQSLNLGQGTITSIDYAKGELQIATTKDANPVIVRVRINDPIGRFGKSHGGTGSGAALIEPGYDQRFSIDEESPTVHAVTGYPMCIPRTNPFSEADDPLCPQANRPRSPNCKSLPSPFPDFVQPADGQFCTTFVMDPPGTIAAPCPTGTNCAPPPSDPTQQAPFEIGDFIDFQGTLKVDSQGPYISAHTIIGSLGIYTTPGTMPAYMAIEVLLQGTSSQPLLNLPQEATSRIKVEGFSTDPVSLVDIYAIDVDPQTGATSDRLLGTVNPMGPPVIGRFRFFPNAGAYIPATREVRVVSRTLCGDPFFPCALANVTQPASLPANGLIAGQYHAPNFEFIFPENLILGDAVVSANLQDLPFLYCGSGPLTTPTGGQNGPVVRQLNPAPWAPPMGTPAFAATLCSGEPVVGAVTVTGPPAPPLITVFPGATLTVNSGAAVFLSASATDSTGLPVGITWVQSSGPQPPSAATVPPGQPNAITFTAPYAASQMVFTVGATNPTTGLTSTATVTVNVRALPSDFVTITTANWTSQRKNRGALNVTAVTTAPLGPNGLPPPDLQLYVQAMANILTYTVDASGYLNFQMSAVQMSATPLPMFFAPTGNPAVCPIGVARCWQFATRGVIADPNNAGVFVPPDEVKVTSSYGGSFTATQYNGIIQVR